MEVFVYYQTNDLGFELNQAVLYGDDAEIQLSELQNALESVQTNIDSWVETHRGQTLLLTGTVGVFKIEAEHVYDLKKLASYLHSFTTLEYSFGVGIDIQHAQIASDHGEKHGNWVSFYADEMWEELQEEEEPLDQQLTKAEQPHEVARQQEDPTQQIQQALQLLKQNSQQIDQLKQAAPGVYDTIRHISQTMVTMAKMIAEVKTAARNHQESMQKSESLAKSVPQMTQEDSDNIGTPEKFAEHFEQTKHMNHVATNPMANGLFHHVFDLGGGAITAHTISRSKDPTKLPLSQLHADQHDDGTPQIATVSANPAVAGQGFGKLAYVAAANHHGKIYSDTSMSDRAAKVYPWLQQQGHTVEHGPDERIAISSNLQKNLKWPEVIAAVDAGPSGPTQKGKIKTRVREQDSGKKKASRWRSVRSGMVMSQLGGVASARKPNVL